MARVAAKGGERKRLPLEAEPKLGAWFLLLGPEAELKPGARKRLRLEAELKPDPVTEAAAWLLLGW